MQLLSRQELLSRQVMLSRQGMRSAYVESSHSPRLRLRSSPARIWRLLYLAQRSLLFPVPAVSARRRSGPRRDRPSAARRWRSAGVVPGAGGLFKGPAPLLIFMHGNGELADQWLPDLKRSRRGVSPPCCSSTPVTAVRPAVLRRGRSTKPRVRLTTGPNAMHGSTPSASCRTAALLVAGRRPGLRSIARAPALILESSFTSVAAFAARYLAPAFLVKDRFDSRECVVVIPWAAARPAWLAR